MESEIFGNIHSIETCGTVDGPGIRFVVFLQGCPMRCKYCHNPDTWDAVLNKKMSVNGILVQYEGVKEFCKGGITVTGGEPLLQPEFVAQLFKAAIEKNIHTALDTTAKLEIEEINPNVEEDLANAVNLREDLKISRARRKIADQSLVAARSGGKPSVVLSAQLGL